MGRTLTYEQMMALFAKSHKETIELRTSMAKETAELRTSMAKETAELRTSMAKETAELRANMAKETAELRANMARETAELRASIANLHVIVKKNNSLLEHNNHKIGLLTNKLGGIVESIVIPGIVGKFNEKGFGFDSVSTKVEFLNEERNGNLTEVDALLENGKFVIAVETKTDMSVSDVNEHIKRLKVLRGISRFKGKKIYGALSTAVARKKPINYALEQGFYVLQQPDVMGVKILDFPKGYGAKAW